MRHGSHDITACDVLPGTYGDAIMELILKTAALRIHVKKIKTAALQIEMGAAAEAAATG